MRPHSLTLEGFACFKQRQTVSFDRLELFAIWGATGAGKTSLIDAIVFALFGKVPRLDERRNRDIISLTRDKAVVLLEFGTGPHTYRVVRTARRRGAPEAKLEDADGNSVAEGVREVQAAIQRHLGLSYDAFVQSVVLPQGEFARFLKSEPRQRRMILRDLLRLDVYERMRSLAEQRRRDLDAQLSGLDKILHDYGDATPERLQALEVSLADAQQDRKAKDERRAVLDAQLQELQLRRRKTEELEQARRHMNELGQAEPRMRASRLRAEASDRAAVVMPAIVRAEEAEKTARTAQKNAQKAREAVDTAQARHDKAQRLAQQAEQDAKQIGPLRDRIRALDGLRGVLEARRGAFGRLEGAKKAAREADTRVRSAREQRDTLEKQLQTLIRRVKTAAEAVRTTAYDKELDALAERAARDATQLGEIRQQLASFEADMMRATSLRAKAEAALAKKTPAAARAHRAYERAGEARERIEQAYQDAHQVHAAAVLRRALRRGEECPVCAQRISTVPKAIPVPKLDVLAKQYEDAKQAEREARDTDKKLAAEQASLEASVRELTGAAATAKRNYEKAFKRVTEREQKLIALVRTRFDTAPGATIEERVLVAAERLAAARKTHAAKTEELVKAERDRDVATSALEGNKREIDGLQETADQAKRQVTDCAGEVERLNAQITAVTDKPNPLAECAALEERIQTLERQLETSKETFTAAAADLTTAKSAAKDVAEKAATAGEDAADLGRTAEAAARQAGFDSLSAAKTAVIAPGDLAALRRAIDDYQADRKATEQRIAALTEELHGQTVTDAELAEIKTAHNRARAELEDAVGAIARLQEQIRGIRERLTKRAEFAAQHEALKAEHDVYRELADELKTDRFQEFILEESFHELTRGASQRLGDLTGRYALRYEDGNILVVDHDNADETRSADTLSGGETFLASLALALELSEQIQQAAGAARLESLFIDEGFGTLDIEALNGAASAIESLQGSGRMVGIITHIRELADRLPCRIEVEWRSEGSQVEIHPL